MFKGIIFNVLSREGVIHVLKILYNTFLLPITILVTLSRTKVAEQRVIFREQQQVEDKTHLVLHTQFLPVIDSLKVCCGLYIFKRNKTVESTIAKQRKIEGP